MCLDDIDTNLESYPLDRPLSVWDLETGRPIRMNHKKFRNALKKLRDSLTEFDRWLAASWTDWKGPRVKWRRRLPISCRTWPRFWKRPLSWLAGTFRMWLQRSAGPGHERR